jgi:DNA-binding CsgD family transcriptional regulator
VIANPAVIPWRSYLSSARLAAGDRDRAREVANEEVDLTRRFGAPRPLGIALRSAGLAERGKRGVELLKESVATLRRSPSRLELARALIDLGAAIRRGGRRAEARQPLREGLELAQRFGAVVLERRAREELLATGARPRKRELTGAASLTPSERRVAEMASSGMTNREVAQTLFVTVKAVQWHLRNGYRKLGIAGRGGAADGARLCRPPRLAYSGSGFGRHWRGDLGAGNAPGSTCFLMRTMFGQRGEPCPYPGRSLGASRPSVTRKD